MQNTVKGLRIRNKYSGFGPYFDPPYKHNFFSVFVDHIGEQTATPQRDPSIRGEFVNKFSHRTASIRFAFDAEFFIQVVSSFINKESINLMKPRTEIIKKFDDGMIACGFELVEIHTSEFIKTEQQIIYTIETEKSSTIDFFSLKLLD